jgi:hypothetical protein
MFLQLSVEFCGLIFWELMVHQMTVVKKVRGYAIVLKRPRTNPIDELRFKKNKYFSLMH